MLRIHISRVISTLLMAFALFGTALGASFGAASMAAAVEPTGSQRPALQDRASGTWTGEYGTLEFRDDGALHVGMGSVGAVGADRAGTVEL